MSAEILNEEVADIVQLTVDVCVVGAGFAGLSAALRLQEKGCGVLVLEARKRVGGRVWTEHKTPAKWLDLGGQWVGGTQTEFMKLIELSQTPTYPTYFNGHARIRGVDAAAALVDSDLDWDGVPGIEKVEAGVAKLQKIIDAINPEAPWLHPQAAPLDRMTFRQWLRGEVNDAHAEAFMEADISYCCAGPEEISVLATCATIAQCGGFKSLDEAAQETRIVEGAQTVADNIVKSLLEPHTVLEGQPVMDIVRTDDYVVVRSKNFEVTAKYVIVTAPPHVAKEIRFHPELPTERKALMQQWPQGTVIKIGMIYDRPFWRDMGLNGLSLDWKAMAVETADSSPTPEASPCGTLTAFIYTDRAREAMDLSPEERQKRVLHEMKERFYGDDRFLKPIDYHETYWTEEVYTKGCYGAFLRPGATTEFKQLIRASTGRIHWAGSETSPVWPTFIECAVRSGYRAADEIVNVLKSAAD